MSLNKSYLLAAGIAALLVIWMLMGEDVPPEQPDRSLTAEASLFRVQFEDRTCH